tara:strand:- start:1405 stop:1731 length:327 start_codon:yes stop_codon:yes gene_type:complete
MDSKGLDLPTNDEELALFLLQGRTFFNLSEVQQESWYYTYYQTTMHIAKNLFLIESAEYMQYDTVRVTIRGTQEVIDLQRFDQSDRFLFREVVEHLLLTGYRNEVYNS